MESGGAAAGSSRSSRKVCRIMMAPVRALCRARDLYVSSMVGLASRAACRGVGGYHGVASAAGSHRLFHKARAGGGGGEDDMTELVRAASQRPACSIKRCLRQPPWCHRKGGGSGASRMQSVGIGRIDEDKVCDFGEEDVLRCG